MAMAATYRNHWAANRRPRAAGERNVNARLPSQVKVAAAMNENTRAAFFDVLEKVKDVQGLLLDCRGMGAGDDDAAGADLGVIVTNAFTEATAEVAEMVEDIYAEVQEDLRESRLATEPHEPQETDKAKANPDIASVTPITDPDNKAKGK